MKSASNRWFSGRKEPEELNLPNPEKELMVGAGRIKGERVVITEPKRAVFLRKTRSQSLERKVNYGFRGIHRTN